MVSPGLIWRFKSLMISFPGLDGYANPTCSKSTEPSATSFIAWGTLDKSGSSVSTSEIRSPDALDIISITKVMDTIIRLIRILMTYVNILISCPSVRLPAIIIFAPIHEINRIQEYMENCMTGEFKASSFSALTNRLRIFSLSVSKRRVS